VIEFTSATDLSLKNADGNPDAYLEACLSQSENPQKFKSRVIKNTKSPVWQEETTFFCDSIQKDWIDVTIFDSDQLGESEKIAKTSFPINAFVIGEEWTTWTSALLSCERKPRPAGVLTVNGRLSLVTQSDEGPAPDDPSLSTYPFIFDDDHCHFSWGVYSYPSTDFSSFAGYGKALSPVPPEEETFHKHAEPKLRKVSEIPPEEGPDYA
jgi:hypothetical protein